MEESNLTDNASPAYAILIHDTINQVSTIISIAQLDMLSKDMSSEVKADMKRIIQTMREVSGNLKRLAEILDEEG
jgi:signal transduction histidine kinase